MLSCVNGDVGGRKLKEDSFVKRLEGKRSSLNGKERLDYLYSDG